MDVQAGCRIKFPGSNRAAWAHTARNSMLHFMDAPGDRSPAAAAARHASTQALRASRACGTTHRPRSRRRRRAPEPSCRCARRQPDDPVALDPGGDPVTVQLTTSSWRAQWEASKVGPLAAQPVRISLGLPKFWPAAAAFPYVAELAPAGLIHIEDDAEFERRYRTRLDRIGVDTLRRRFEQIFPTVGNSALCLLCFEDLSAGDNCHRRTSPRGGRRGPARACRNSNWPRSRPTPERSCGSERSGDERHRPRRDLLRQID